MALSRVTPLFFSSGQQNKVVSPPKKTGSRKRKPAAKESR